MQTGPRSAVDNVSDCSYVSDCRSRGREFDPGRVPYFRGTAKSHTFFEIDHEIISTVILLTSPDSRRVVVSYKPKYVYEVLVNCFVKLAQEKNQVGLIVTDRPDMTRAVDWDVKNQTEAK